MSQAEAVKAKSILFSIATDRGADVERKRHVVVVARTEKRFFFRPLLPQ